MNTVNTIKQARETVKQWRREGLSVGFVPTMGYLHEGHLSLLQKARQENDRVAASIFVNPMQFGPSEDLASYPRDFARDSALCGAAGVDLLFHPVPEEMYRPDFCSFVDMNGLTEGLCGKSRPIHFRGVCTVVTKLFHIIAPDRAYFGQKDAQQLAVIRRMVRDLDMELEIVGCPIVREADGLAKSSRNQYLRAAERQAALVLSRALGAARAALQGGETDCGKLTAAMTACIEAEPLAKIDYVELVDSLTLQPLQTVNRTALIALAVYIGKTRLIDNFTWEAARV